MTDSTQRLVRELFDGASDLPLADRQTWIEARAQGNAEVIQSVMRLLNASGASGRSFLSEPAWKWDRPALEEGVMIGPYRVLRELGSGGMGVVYLTMRSDEVFRRLAALKVVRPELRGDPVLARFFQEREILARLDHPNIARIVDGGTTSDGLPYFVMDYVDGQPLDVFCREHRASIEQRLNLFRQTCEAVEYLHQNNVLHRDLKPANILVTHNGQVKILDFGISKLEGELNSTVTTGMPILTAGYASPEQITGKKVTSASDIYSLGVVLYELLTGIRPLRFDGLGLPDILASVATETPLKPSTLPAHPNDADPDRLLASMRQQLAGDLDSIVLMALRKEPERRYASAAAFATDVERYQTGRPVTARGDGRAYLVRRTLWRNRSLIAASLVIATSLVFAGVAGYKAIQERNQIQSLQDEVRQMKQRTARAEANHDPTLNAQLQQDVNHLAADYDSKLPPVLGSRLMPRASTFQLVQQSLSYLAEARAAAGGDPATVAAIGRAYLSIAQSQWSPDHPSLNNAADAARTCMTALRALNSSPALLSSVEMRQVASRLSILLQQVYASGKAQ